MRPSAVPVACAAKGQKTDEALVVTHAAAMTEAELIAAFQGYVTLTNQLFFGYVSLLSGFLMMSYLVADRISSFLAWISLGMFSLVSFLLLFGMHLSQNDAEQLVTFMREQAQLGQLDLLWLGRNPPWAANVMYALYVVAIPGGYIASIVYFYYKRTHTAPVLYKTSSAPLIERE